MNRFRSLFITLSLAAFLPYSAAAQTANTGSAGCATLTQSAANGATARVVRQVRATCSGPWPDRG